MNRVLRKLGTRPWKSAGEAGQGLAEYALILTFVALACVVALSQLGVNIANSPGFTTLPGSL